MNVQSIIDRARRLAYVSSAQYNDTRAIEDFNIIYKELVSNVAYQIDEDFFWDVFKTNTVDGQSEYVLPSNVSKLKEVFIKWSATDTYYTKATEIDGNDLENDPAYYEATYSKSSPAFYVADESIFILPAPIETLANGIKLNAIKGATDLLITDDETTIILPKEFHYIIAEGMRQFIYQGRGLINEKNDATNNYQNEMSNMIGKLTDRTLSPTTGLLPDLTYYS